MFLQRAHRGVIISQLFFSVAGDNHGDIRLSSVTPIHQEMSMCHDDAPFTNTTFMELRRPIECNDEVEDESEELLSVRTGAISSLVLNHTFPLNGANLRPLVPRSRSQFAGHDNNTSLNLTLNQLGRSFCGGGIGNMTMMEESNRKVFERLSKAVRFMLVLQSRDDFYYSDLIFELV